MPLPPRFISLRRARLKAHLTQVQLSARSGVSASLISAMEQGRGNPTQHTLRRLAKELGVEPYELVVTESRA